MWDAPRMTGTHESTGQAVVVVGGGLAGACAAIEASRAGAKVTLVERADRLGGNSAKASSGMSVARDDSDRELFLQDILAAAGDLCEPTLATLLVDESREGLGFIESFGVDLSSTTQCGAHSAERTHRNAPGNVGMAIMKALGHAIEEDTNIATWTSTSVDDLLLEDGRVVGIRCQKKGEDAREVRCPAVVLATGGFAANPKALSEWAPRVAYLPTTNGAGSDGSGLRLGSRAGGALHGIDQVQVHPTALVPLKSPDPGAAGPSNLFLAPEALRGSGFVLLSGAGRRFVDELGRRDVVTSAIDSSGFDKETGVGRTGRAAWLVGGEQAAQRYGRAALEFYAAKGFAAKVAGAEELAALVGCETAAIEGTFAEYNTAVDGEREDATGKRVFPCRLDPREQMYAMVVTPATHYCMGGLRIDADCSVLGSDGAPIPGLLGAGEVTGGVHGRNRIAGCSLAECCVFGRRAGKAAGVSALGGKMAA